MAQFKTITEAVLRNSDGGELNRMELTADQDGLFFAYTIEERETEVE